MVTPLSLNKEEFFHPLFASALMGDQQAYGKLLREVAELSKRYVRRKIGGSADGDDIIQEILISVHKALHTYDISRPCMPWLAAIMHYRVSDWLRTRYQQLESQKVPLDDVEECLLADVTQSPLEYEHVTKAVNSLPNGQQAVIKAMYSEDLSVKETADKLGMGISAVKVTAHRAYKKLRERLEEP